MFPFQDPFSFPLSRVTIMRQRYIIALDTVIHNISAVNAYHEKLTFHTAACARNLPVDRKEPKTSEEVRT